MDENSPLLTNIQPEKPSTQTEDATTHKDLTSASIGLEVLPNAHSEQQASESGLFCGSQTRSKAFKERSVYFDDKVRKIDFVLTYTDPVVPEGGEISEKAKKTNKRRDYYQSQLKKRGVEIEIQTPEDSPDKKTYFVKLHGTWEGLIEIAEKYNIRVPIHDQDDITESWREKFFKLFKMKDPMEPNIPEQFAAKDYYTALFQKSKFDSYIGHENPDTFFTDAQRSLIVYTILMETPYSAKSLKVGLDRVISKGTYSSAFPIHDGPYFIKPKEEPLSHRQALFKSWASPWAFYKTQPLDEIREYFGEKVAIYFSFLGTYTKWLHLSTIIGLLVFLYGLTTLGNSSRNPIAQQGCDQQFYMCPLCSERCDFWFYSSSCTAFWFALLFDNEATVLFAIFMAFWCTLFLEAWKRQQATLQYEWDLLGFEEEEQRPRPKYELQVKHNSTTARFWRDKWTSVDPITKLEELSQPQALFFTKVIATVSILVTMLLIVIGFVIAVIFYKVLVRLALTIAAAQNGAQSITPLVGICVTVSGACIQLVFIIIMNKIYTKLAVILTDWELHKTQTEHDDSFTFKMFLFQCVNFYSAIFYIAFIKGKILVPYPGIRGFKLTECEQYGCLLELCLNLAIVFCGKQLLNNGQELGVPVAKYFVKRALNWWKARKESDEEKQEEIYTRYEQDFDLPDEGEFGLFSEYLELIIQYGFVTLFVAAFPLAPLFALLNNYAEIRLDAFKYLCLQRRVVAIRAADIGIWYGILDGLSKAAVISNAFLIAFTATFIDRITYAAINPLGIATYNNLNGYLDYTLGQVPVRLLNRSQTFPLYAFQALTDPNCTASFFSSETCPLYRPYYVNGTICCGNANSCDVSLNATFNNNNQTCCDLVWLNVDKLDSMNNSIHNARSNSTNNRTVCYVEFINQNLTCRFRGRFQANPYSDNNEYYYRVVIAKLVFVLLFEHIVFLLSGVIALLIPDIPASINNQILRERHLTKETLFQKLDAKTPLESPTKNLEDVEQGADVSET